MSLKKSFLVIFVSLSILFSIFSIIELKLINDFQESVKNRNLNFKSHSLIKEVSENIDFLSGMAQSYIITGKIIFEEKYYKYLYETDIKMSEYFQNNRDFLKVYEIYKRLLRSDIILNRIFYFGVYPDISGSDNLETIDIFGVFSSIKAQQIKAMRAFNGLFEDAKGNFTIKNEPDLVLANTLLNNGHLNKKIRDLHQTLSIYDDRIDKYFPVKVSGISDLHEILSTTTFSFLIIILLFILFAFYFLKKNVSIPIDKLLNFTDKIIEGNDQNPIHLPQLNEIGKLANRINIILENIKILISGMQDLTRGDFSTRLKYNTNSNITQNILNELSRYYRILYNTLQNREIYFKNIFERGPLGMTFIDQDLNFIRINSALCNMLGFTQKELSMLSLKSIIHPEFIEKDLKEIEKLRNKEITIYKCEEKYIKKNNDTIWGSVTFSGIYDDNNRFQSFLMMVEDINERILTLDALRESEERFKAIFNYAPLGIAIIDFQKRYRESNMTLQNILGYDKDELHNFTFPQLTHPDYIAQDEIYFNKLISGESQNLNIEKRYIHKNGNVIWGSLNASLIRDSNGEPDFIITMLQDITERKMVEKILKESEARLVEALEIGGMAHWELNLKTLKIKLNDQIFKLLGIPVEKPADYEMDIQSALEGIILPEDLENVKKVIRDILIFQKSEKPEQFEFRTLNSSGKIQYFFAKYKVISDEDLHPVKVYGILLDITNRKIIEDEIKKHRENLEELVIERTNELEISEKSVHLLKDVALSAYKATSTAKAMHTALGLIAKHTDSAIGHIFFPSLDTGRLISSHIWYFDLPEKYILLKEVTENYKFYFDKGILGKVYTDKKAVFYDDLHSFENSPRAKTASKLGLYRFFSFPIIMNEKVEAVLEFFGQKTKSITQNYSDIIDQVADQLAIIMEHKKNEEDLRKLSLVVKQSPVSVVITDRKGSIEYANMKFYKVSGYNSDEVIGQNARILNSGYQDSRYYKNLWDTILSGDEWKGEFANKRKNGEIYWESASISPILNPDGEITHFVAVKEDITEQRLAAEELKRAKDAAEVANQAKSEFLSNMSHEIRTPMNAILGFAEILSDKINDPEFKHYLNVILNSGNMLLSIINDTLDISKIEAGKLDLQPEYINLAQLLHDLKYMFTDKIEDKNIELILDLQSDFPNGAYLDEFRIKQIILNLLSNAVKFTEKGFIKISARYSYKNPEKDSADIFFEIEDSGIGIPEDQIEKIFSPFEQIDGQMTRKYGGTGLGLAILLKLVKIMNGSVSVKSKYGEGSIFSISIPDVKIRLETQIVQEINPELNCEIIFNPSRILVVDDVETNRILIKKYLERHNIEVIEADGGENALDIIKKEKFDLILLDLRMPGLNGIELAKILREATETMNIPLLMLTASVFKERENNALKYVDGYLHKPITRIKLIHELKKYLKYDSDGINNEPQSIESGIIPPDIPLDIIEPEKINNLINILQQDYFTEWEFISKTKEINSIKLFCNKLKITAQQFNSNLLINYCDEILEALKVLKVFKIKNLLNNFPVIIKELGKSQK